MMAPVIICAGAETRNAITPANGLIIYNTTDNRPEFYISGIGWYHMSVGPATP